MHTQHLRKKKYSAWQKEMELHYALPNVLQDAQERFIAKSLF